MPPESVDSVIDALGLRSGTYILHVGTMEPRKNLVRLVQAFAKLRRSRLAIQLVLAGAQGWMYEDVLAEVERLGLEEDVIVLGRVDAESLPALYNGARCVAYPSLYEGFGLPVLEAMACGTPIVTSRTSSLPEVVGDAGVLVDPYDVGQIAEALEQLIVDEDAARCYAQRGRQRASAFSWEATARKTLQVYENAEGW
jgi:glycosyltransferase involved in cell wall biosynthesis